jgi:Icc-related predicted phosphoesterase
MKMLLVSDLHYSLRQLDWVVGAASDYDIVVIAGDLLSINSAVEADAQIAVVLQYLSRVAAKATLAVCSGNHDLNAQNELGERAAVWLEAARADGVHTDGAHIVTDDVFMTVCPWWDGPKTREQVAARFAADAGAVGERMWIWVYHAPPSGSPTSWTGSRSYGDDDLNAWIEQYQPALVCCGHVHQSPWADGGGWSDRIGETCVVNSGREGGPVPPHVTIDIDGRELRWLSSDSAGEVAFAPS